MLTEIASEAGDYLRSVFGTPVDVEVKNGPSDLVTVHDRIVEKKIRRRMEAALPGVRIVGEEDGVSGGVGEVVCYIDPIDGTSNFASGVPFYCVSLALTISDRVVAGVVHDPEREETFSATGTSSLLNGNPVRATLTTRDRDALLISSWPYEGGVVDRSELADYELALASFRTVRRLGSAALGLAYVAAGRADVTSELIAKPWDVAAGFLLVTSAQGRITRSPASAGDPSWYAPRYIAHGPDFDVSRSSIRHSLADPVRSYSSS
ncbi:inositol monophosphatase family protein [Pseudactinotalea sp. Z1732]|uniref:inositol monophosphatase family protein n=1 Tax=Micrococcales TaxID=85006 RepID=UPI003C7D7129